MATTYADDQVAASPPWLQGPNGTAWARSLGDVKDSIVDSAVQAVKARCPSVCPSDALSFIGGDRLLDRGVAETDVQYRARLVGAWIQWQWAGTPYGMLQALLLAGYPSVQIQTQSGRGFVLDGSGNLVTSTIASIHLGGSPELWSDIGVFITQPWPAWWGGSPPADGSADQRTVSALVKKWKNAHNRCVKLNVINGPTWGFAGLTWNGFSYGSGTSVTWMPPAG